MAYFSCFASFAYEEKLHMATSRYSNVQISKQREFLIRGQIMVNINSYGNNESPACSPRVAADALVILECATHPLKGADASPTWNPSWHLDTRLIARMIIGKRDPATLQDVLKHTCYPFHRLRRTPTASTGEGNRGCRIRIFARRSHVQRATLSLDGNHPHHFGA